MSQKSVRSCRRLAFLRCPQSKRPVHPPHERKQRLILLLEERRQLRTRHLRIRQRPPACERLIPEPLRRWMILGVPARNSLECTLIAEPTEPLRQRLDHPNERLRL